MRRWLTLAAAALLLSTAALAQSVGEKTGVNSALGISPTTADFFKEVAMSDMTEIAAAKIGQERGNAEEKAFSTQMIADHTKTSAELKARVPAEAKAALPTALDNSSQSKMPFPLWSNFTTRERPSALVVLTVSPARLPSGLIALTSIVVEPSALWVTVCWVA